MRLLVCTLAFAALPAQSDDPPGVRVSGRALNSVSGRPVAGGYVRLRNPEGERHGASTGADGRFVFEAVKPGRYSISGSAPGPMEARAYLNVPEGTLLSGIELELEPTGVIAGRVTDDRGRPIVGVYIEALVRSADQQTGRSFWRRHRGRNYNQSAYTNDRGEYRVWGLSPGEYIIAATPPLEPAPLGMIRLSAAPALYPNAQTLAEAAPVQLSPGQVREAVDIRLGPASTAIQSGRVILPAEIEDCRDCRVSIYRRDAETDLQILGGLINLVQPDRGGAFTLAGLPPGEYVAAAWLAGQARTSSYGQVPFRIGREPGPLVTVGIFAPVPITGRVVLEDLPEDWAEPPPSPNPFPEFNLARTEATLRDSTKSQVCRSEAAGLVGGGPERTFELLAQPGRCKLAIRGPQGSYLAGIALDGRPLETPEIDISPTGLPGELVARVRFDLGTISGRVDDYARPGGPGLEPYLDVLALIPTGGRARWNRLSYAVIQPDGSFESSLAPGTYGIVGGRWVGWALFDRIAREDRGRPQVHVKPGETTTLTLPADALP